MALRTQARRVKVLENGSGGGGDVCPRCGWGGDNYGPFELVFEDDGAVEEEEMEEEMEEEIFCSECGTQLTIFFDDDVRAPWNQTRLGSWSRRSR